MRGENSTLKSQTVQALYLYSAHIVVSLRETVRPLRGKIKSKIKSENVSMGYRCQLKPKTPSAGARFSYINRRGKYERQDDDLAYSASRNMPEFAAENPADFWFAADEFERSNARVCVEFELNLPPELDLKQQISCVENFIDSLNAKAGKFPISYAIHHDKNGTNPHVHLMLSERALDGIERPAEQFFKRANSKKPELGGNKKSLFFNRSSENVLWTRASWAESCNNALVENGFDARFDSRPKTVQRAQAIEEGDLRRAVSLSTLTEKHEGPVRGSIRKRLASGELERDSVDLEVLQLLDSNDTIKGFNRELELFAVTASDDQLRAFLACESAADRVEFIAKIYTSTPTPTEPENYGFHESQQSFEPVSAHGGGLQQHIEHLFVVQARQNNLLLQQALSRSEPREICGGEGNLPDARGFVRPAVQPLDTEPSGGLRDVRRAELSQEELIRLYRQAEIDAADAELRADFAGCRVDELRANARQLLSGIEAARPTVLQRVLIKIGLSVDQSIELKRGAGPLLDSIRQAEIELKQLSDRARDLRIYADDLKIRANYIEKPRPSGESVGYDFYLLKQQLERELVEKQRSVTESHGNAAPAPASTQLDRKPRGQRL